MVSAKLTPSKRELLVLCRTLPQSDDTGGLSTLTATTISLATMKAAVPRIDLPDVSAGSGCPPAFELSHTLVSTGSEYLLADLGCGVVGAFSLATGQLVREVRLHSMAPPAGPSRAPGGLFGPAAAAEPTGVVLCSLQWLQILGGDGGGRVGGQGRRTLLAAACVGGQHVALIELDLEGAAQQVKQEKEEQALERERQQQQQQRQQARARQQRQQQQGQFQLQATTQQQQQPPTRLQPGELQQQIQHSRQLPEAQLHNNIQQQHQQMRQHQQQQVQQHQQQRAGGIRQQQAQQPALKQPRDAARKSSVRFDDIHKQTLDKG